MISYGKYNSLTFYESSKLNCNFSAVLFLMLGITFVHAEQISFEETINKNMLFTLDASNYSLNDISIQFIRTLSECPLIIKISFLSYYQSFY